MMILMKLKNSKENLFTMKRVSLLYTYIVLNSSRYSSSPLFSLINRSNLSISSDSTSLKVPLDACANG